MSVMKRGAGTACGHQKCGPSRSLEVEPGGWNFLKLPQSRWIRVHLADIQSTGW